MPNWNFTPKVPQLEAETTRQVIEMEVAGVTVRVTLDYPRPLKREELPQLTISTDAKAPVIIS